MSAFEPSEAGQPPEAAPPGESDEPTAEAPTVREPRRAATRSAPKWESDVRHRLRAVLVDAVRADSRRNLPVLDAVGP